MKKMIISIIVIGLLSTSSLVSTNALEIDYDKSQELEINMDNNTESFDGYILSNTILPGMMTYLLDGDKNIAHFWINEQSALTSYLREDGKLIRACQSVSILDTPFYLGGTGRVEILNWYGIRTWNFEYCNSQRCLHHDIAPLPNGNILMTAWEIKTPDEAIAAGHNPDINSLGMAPDHIIEVEPTGQYRGNIVWEWHIWDHLIQDFDPSKANYGVIADHPELIDINLGDFNANDWLHINSIDYNEELDQILLSSWQLKEILIIDHSTTTEEAAGHTGGNSGKGGDVLYRWGNPQNYDGGDGDDRKLFGQHDARWIESGCPGEGHITFFHNGGDGHGNSSVDEIVTPVDNNGNYYLEPGSAFGPEEPIWRVISGEGYDFTSGCYSGAQRLPNGNTLIVSGEQAKFFVVTRYKKLVWEKSTGIGNGTRIFNMHYYPLDYSGVNALSESLETEYITNAATATSTQSSQPSSQPISKTTTQTTIGSTTLLSKTTSK